MSTPLKCPVCGASLASSLQSKEAKYKSLLENAIMYWQTEYIDWEKFQGPYAEPDYKPEYPKALTDLMEMKKKVDAE